MTKEFNYKEVAQGFKESVFETILDGISEKDCEYIAKMVENYSLMTGETLVNDNSLDFTDEQITTFMQIIAEWTFFKSIDLIKSNVPFKEQGEVLQQIAFNVFEITKQGFKKNLEMDVLLDVIEKQVHKVYNLALDKLLKNKKISKECYESAINSSNTDDMEKDVASEKCNKSETNPQLGVDIVEIQVNEKLISFAEKFMKDGKTKVLRERLISQLGYIIPNIRVRDNSELDDFEYEILIRGEHVESGCIYPDRVMIIQDEYEELPDDAIIGIEPCYQTSCYWIKFEDIPKKQKNSLVITEPCDVITTHLSEVLIKYVDEILSTYDVNKYIELVQESEKENRYKVIDSLLERINLEDIRQILSNLIREKISIKDISYIFDRLNEYSKHATETYILSERIRVSLGRQICLKNSNDNKTLYALTLSDELESLLNKNCQRTELGVMFSISPLQINELIETIKVKLIQTHQKIGEQPVILCSPKIRLSLYQLLIRQIPSVVIISYSELINDIMVESVGEICTESYNY